MTHDERQSDSNRVKVRVLGPTDAAAAATVLAQAFDQEPAKLTILPNSAARRVILEMSLRARLYDPLRYGAVHGAWMDNELAAVAVWYPPGVPVLSSSGAMRAVLILPSIIGSLARAFPHIVRTLLSDVRGMFRLFRKRPPAVKRAAKGLTWHLDLLGTLPEHRGKGLARALLDRQLHRCDQDGAAAWLEATDPVNPKIYARFGFETIMHTDGPRWLLGYWVMRRQPHAIQVRN
jgi:GNAT superfamily N-acetyltransferase